jgi:hypothetical protein
MGNAPILCIGDRFSGFDSVVVCEDAKEFHALFGEIIANCKEFAEGAIALDRVLCCTDIFNDDIDDAIQVFLDEDGAKYFQFELLLVGAALAEVPPGP